MYRHFHICTHQIAEKQGEAVERTMEVRNGDSQIDLIVRGASVLEILNVYALEYRPHKRTVQLEHDSGKPADVYDHPDTEKGHYDAPFHFYQDYSEYFSPGADRSRPLPDSFFSIHLKNRIQWHVEPPTRYLVQGIIRYDREGLRTVSAAVCDRCQGRGWYSDILNNEGRFEEDKGIVKVTQRVVKDILTDLFSSRLKRDYGTLIKRTVATSYKDDESMFDDVRLIISEVEQRYLQRQIAEYGKLPPTERLVAVRTNRLVRAQNDPRRLILELQIITEEEDNIFRLGL